MPALALVEALGWEEGEREGSWSPEKHLSPAAGVRA